MALMGSLGSGVTAMQSFVKGMEVIGDNIANSKTVGFKRQRVNYADNFSDTLRDASPSSNSSSNTTPIQFGSGVNIGAAQKVHQQGSIELTGIASDLAISGDGFFRVFDPGSGSQFLTRDGSFRLDDNGFLTDKNGFYLLGLTGGDGVDQPETIERIRVDLARDVKVNANGEPLDASGRIVLEDGSRVQTTADGSGDTYRVDSTGRLLATAPENNIILNNIGGSQATARYNATDGSYFLVNSDGNYIDSTGVEITDGGVTVAFDSTTAAPAGAVAWDPTDEIQSPPDNLILRTIGGSEARAVFDPGSGQYHLRNTDGQFINGNGVVSGTPIVWNPSTQPLAKPGDVEASVAIWDPIVASSGAIDAVPNVAAVNVDDSNQFQLAIQSWAFNKDGGLVLSLNDGSSYLRAQVMLQTVSDPNALSAEGNGLLSGFQNAGVLGLSEWNLGTQLSVSDRRFHLANQSGLGSIQGRALEASNTDLTSEFSNMITTQRAFQAGSRVITVSDEMLQEIINLKR